MSGPEVPFPMKTIEEVFCRDCPFPMKGEWPDDVLPALEKWRSASLATLKTRANADTTLTGALIGKQLEVLGQHQAGTLDFRPNRVRVRVDDQQLITSVTVGQ